MSEGEEAPPDPREDVMYGRRERYVKDVESITFASNGDGIGVPLIWCGCTPPANTLGDDRWDWVKESVPKATYDRIKTRAGEGTTAAFDKAFKSPMCLYMSLLHTQEAYGCYSPLEPRVKKAVDLLASLD